MIIILKIVMFLSMYFKVLRAGTCLKQAFGIGGSNPNDHKYVSLPAERVRFMPKDPRGRQNIDNICPIGYTCLPNYIKPSIKKLMNRIKSLPKKIRNRKYKAHPYVPTSGPSTGCLGLDNYDFVALRSPVNRLYLASCEHCTHGSSAKYNTLAMVYTDFNSPEARWKMVPEDGMCTIKNLFTGKYLSRCDDCAPMEHNITMTALFRSSIDDNTNDEKWIVTRKRNGRFLFKSASRGGYLGTCKECGLVSSSIRYAGAIFSTKRDSSFVAWEVDIDPKVGVYS